MCILRNSTKALCKQPAPLVAAATASGETQLRLLLRGVRCGGLSAKMPRGPAKMCSGHGSVTDLASDRADESHTFRRKGGLLLWVSGRENITSEFAFCYCKARTIL